MKSSGCGSYRAAHSRAAPIDGTTIAAPRTVCSTSRASIRGMPTAIALSLTFGNERHAGAALARTALRVLRK